MSALDWSRPVRTQHSTPLVGDVRGAHPLVEGAIAVALPSLSVFEPHKSPTVWHYGDNGRRRGDRSPSKFDLVNFDPNDGVQVVRLEPR